MSDVIVLLNERLNELKEVVEQRTTALNNIIANYEKAVINEAFNAYLDSDTYTINIDIKHLLDGIRDHRVAVIDAKEEVKSLEEYIALIEKDEAKRAYLQNEIDRANGSNS